MRESAGVQRPLSSSETRIDANEFLGTQVHQGQHSALNFRTLLQLLTVLAAGLFIYGLWLGNSPLDRTEPFRALVAHQMVKGGSWLVPRLYGEVYLRKPPLIYWIQAIVEKMIGHGDEFVWRLPSAVGSALLAVFIAWWSGRWFGPRAILPGGFACLALVALWDQNRGADIDALNTAFAVVTAACVLEIIYGNTRRPFVWCIALGLSLGATLLLKGPGGVPQAIAAIAGPAILLRNGKPLARRTVPLAIGFLIGSAIFAVYIVAAKREMQQLHIVPDHTGWYEVIAKIFFHDWRGRLRSLGIPFAMFIFALPVSAVVPFAILSLRRLEADDPRRVQATAILATLLAALLIWVLGGNDNPRYEYVMLPLLAPLVGFVWTQWDRQEMWFTRALLGVGCMFAIASAILMVRIHSMPGFPVLCSVLVLALIALIWSALQNRPAVGSPGPILVVLLLCFAAPMAARKNGERQRKSAKTPAAQLRAIIGDAPRYLPPVSCGICRNCSTTRMWMWTHMASLVCPNYCSIAVTGSSYRKAKSIPRIQLFLSTSRAPFHKA